MSDPSASPILSSLPAGAILGRLLPGELAWRFASLERYGLLIIVGAAFIVPMIGQQLGYDLNPLATVLWPMIHLVYSTVLLVTGW